MRKKYGTTWWGKQWLNALGEIDYSNRLPRGRTYANKGAARDIEIVGNRISAKVKGSQPRPYKVDITVPTFSASQKAKIIELVTSNPLYLSQLLNREIPNQLNEACKKAGIHIFPRSWKEISGNCSCPDWAVPCKHLASVLYLIANEIDKNPFLVFELHGFDLFKGLEGVGYSLSGQKDVRILNIEELWEKTNIQEIDFQLDEAALEQLDFTKIPELRDNLLVLLNDQPVFSPSKDFKQLLTKSYKGITRAMKKSLKAEVEDHQNLILDAADEIELILDSELDFLYCNIRDARGKLLLKIEREEKLMNWLKQIPFANLPYYSAGLRGLYFAHRFAQQLAFQSAMIPQLLKVGTQRYKVRWLPANLNEQVRAVHEIVAQLIPPNLLFYKVSKDILAPSPQNHLSDLLSFFLNHFVHQYHNLDYRDQETEAARLFFNGSVEKFGGFEQREYPNAIQLWLNRFYIVEKNHVPVLKIDDLDGGFEVSIALEDKSKPMADLISLDDLLNKNDYSGIRLDALRDMAMLAEYFPQISNLVASKGKEKLLFDSEEFVSILFKILPTIRLFGIKVLMPKALRKLLRPQMSMALESDDESGIVKKTSIISMESMLRFKWQVAIGDQILTRQEFLKLVKELSGIVKMNDQYVFFDEKEIASLIDKLENPPEPSPNELLQIALTESYNGAKVTLDKNTQQLIQRLLSGEGTETPKGLKATLRPYQQTGYEWLYKNTRLGFGSLIADDMGLGKTLQVITTILKLKEDGELGKSKVLTIVPTTLLTNWQKEIQKFAPDLNTHIYHGSNRQLEPLKEADVLITTYGVVRTETSKLQKQKWLAVVIDEAQNIKNPKTAQTKAVKKIKAPVKIAMSGTPVENRLSEYWSIFDFTNKGYLSTLTKFKDRFARPIEIDRDQEQLKQFRQVTEPFILRRLKSDKSIIKDLPDKIEKDQYCELTKEQAALYQNVVDTTMKTIEEAEGIARRGLILKLITALKQICNHPKQFLKKGKDDADLSGKMSILLDLMQQIMDNGEKVLIFTQYQQMGKILVKILEEQFGYEIPFLHGGVSRKGRDEMVEDFQHNRATRCMILSLKAGGTGLNLTAASNVIHYDLWWNPAVEAQATDRAYRIGQERNVLVHRFITQATFEEKINKLLQEKKELANLTVSTGEKWIGELSNDELKNLVKLE
ncbi:MAG: DEAD/DEAH box helicase [Bacteroidota bacterium]